MLATSSRRIAFAALFWPFVCASVVSGAANEEAAPSDLHDGLAVARPSEAGLSVGALAGLPEAITRGDYPRTNAVLIVRRGTLVYERYFNDGSPDLLNDTRSAMKSVTSLAVGAAITEGAIASVRSPAFALLGDLRPFANDTAAKQAITIQDLLTMSSALDCNDDDDRSPGKEDNMHLEQNWTRWAADLPTMVDYRRDAAGLGPWRYCTAGAFLLGQIVQRAVHARIDDYIQRRLLDPLGISKRQWPTSPSGEIMTGGGLRLRARDATKIAWMLVDGGRWQGKEIVPKPWIDEALTVRRPANSGQTYGYLFWNRDYATPCGKTAAWFMAGNGGNAVVMLRDLDAAVVIARTNYNTKGMHQQTADMLEKYILPSLPCRGSPSPRRSP
jgi:CubicO group peptidase (beta-lactamase class C family)